MREKKIGLFSTLKVILTHLPGIPFMGHSKQNSPRCDVAERGYSVCLENFHKKLKKIKITPDAPKMKVDSP